MPRHIRPRFAGNHANGKCRPTALPKRYPMYFAAQPTVADRRMLGRTRYTSKRFRALLRAASADHGAPTARRLQPSRPDRKDGAAP